jgi:hypothetical protein
MIVEQETYDNNLDNKVHNQIEHMAIHFTLVNHIFMGALQATNNISNNWKTYSLLTYMRPRMYVYLY